MKIAITGATGYVGSWTVPLALERGYDVRCIVRRTSDVSRLPSAIEIAHADLANEDEVRAALEGCEGLINIASLGSGWGRGIVNAAERAGIRRAVFISTTAVMTTLHAPTKRIRLEAENAIRESRLAWTILRPTMIYGSAADRNMWRLVRYLRRFPVIPIFGSGTYLQQPVFVEDVARAALLAFESEVATGKIYNISGAQPLTYAEVIDTAARAVGRRVWKLRIPSRPIVAALRLIERARLKLPIKAEQIQRLNEDKAFEWSDAARDFGYAPLSFAEGIAREVANP